MLLRETFPAGPFECNCTVLACGDTKDAVIIDPGGEVDKIAELVAHYDLTVRAIIHTHAHLDHIYCTRDVKDAHGGEVCLHQGDAFLYDGFAMQARMFGWKPRASTPVERWINHGDVIAMGKRGRTDLPGGDRAQLDRSIRERLYTRDLDAVVIPGHGPVTKLGDEARGNPFVRA